MVLSARGSVPPAGWCGSDAAVAPCPWHTRGLQGHLGRGGRGKDAAVLLESPDGSCSSSRHLGRQIVKAKMEMAKLPVLKGCPGGAGS